MKGGDVCIGGLPETPAPMMMTEYREGESMNRTKRNGKERMRVVRERERERGLVGERNRNSGSPFI